VQATLVAAAEGAAEEERDKTPPVVNSCLAFAVPNVIRRNFGVDGDEKEGKHD
jgi:hypothetical protein